jgi:hypothetical protein
MPLRTAKPMPRPLSVSLDASMLMMVRAIAARQGVSVSSLVRTFVKEGIEAASTGAGARLRHPGRPRTAPLSPSFHAREAGSADVTDEFIDAGVS